MTSKDKKMWNVITTYNRMNGADFCVLHSDLYYDNSISMKQDCGKAMFTNTIFSQKILNVEKSGYYNAVKNYLVNNATKIIPAYGLFKTSSFGIVAIFDDIAIEFYEGLNED